MADYLSREEILRVFDNLTVKNPNDKYQHGMQDAIDCLIPEVINGMEAADVQPVKRGKWCPPLMGQGKFATYCSFCQYTVMRNAAGIFEETPFCPYCGAKMSNE